MGQQCWAANEQNLCDFSGNKSASQGLDRHVGDGPTCAQVVEVQVVDGLALLGGPPVKHEVRALVPLICVGDPSIDQAAVWIGRC